MALKWYVCVAFQRKMDAKELCRLLRRLQVAWEVDDFTEANEGKEDPKSKNFATDEQLRFDPLERRWKRAAAAVGPFKSAAESRPVGAVPTRDAAGGNLAGSSKKSAGEDPVRRHPGDQAAVPAGRAERAAAGNLRARRQQQPRRAGFETISHRPGG